MACNIFSNLQASLPPPAVFFADSPTFWFGGLRGTGAVAGPGPGSGGLARQQVRTTISLVHGNIKYLPTCFTCVMSCSNLLQTRCGAGIWVWLQGCNLMFQAVDPWHIFHNLWSTVSFSSMWQLLQQGKDRLLWVCQSLMRPHLVWVAVARKIKLLGKHCESLHTSSWMGNYIS